ncbi:hypothetical protein AB0D54_17810 [Streptomyces xanthophaeus]
MCVGMLTADFIAHVPGLPEPLHGPQMWVAPDMISLMQQIAPAPAGH